MTHERQLDADPSNAGQVASWDGNDGEFWAANADRFDDGIAALHLRYLAAIDVDPHDRVLDIGCGNGQLTRDIARLAGSGSALGVDLSSQMISVAREAAAIERIDNATFLQADAQVYPFDEGAFDLVVSRMGSMFFGNPVTAFTNLRRALHPGGRLALLAWQALAENEWLTELRAAMAVGRDLPTPPPTAPSPFGLSDPDRVRTILGAAGFTDISLESVSAPMRFGTDPDEAFAFVSQLTAWMRTDLNDSDTAAALTALRTSIDAHTGPTGVTYAAAAWTIRGLSELT